MARPRVKRTRAVDITGKWIDKGDRIERYKDLPKDIKCSKCITGTDKECPVCHGAQCEPELKWYQLVKKLKKLL